MTAVTLRLVAAMLFTLTRLLCVKVQHSCCMF